MLTNQPKFASSCALHCSSLSSTCSSEISSLIAFLVDLCLQSDSRVHEQHSIACYILAKWTTELESHPGTYSFFSLKPGILLTNSTSLDNFNGSPSKKRKLTTSHQKHRQRSEMGRRMAKSGDGPTAVKRKSETRKSKSKKTTSNEQLLNEHSARCSHNQLSTSTVYECVEDAPTKRQRSRRKSSSTTANSKPPLSFSALAPKKSQSSHILLQQQRPSTAPTSTIGATIAHRPNTAHGSRSCAKFTTLTSDFKCIKQDAAFDHQSNKNNNGALRRFLTAVELTKDEACLVLLCRIVCGYLRHCKTTESRRRFRDCIRLDVVGCCLRALHALLSAPYNEMNRIAMDTLAHTILCFSKKDRKFLLKVRLSGIVPLFIAQFAPSENGPSRDSHQCHGHCRLPNSLRALSFSAHPTALFRLIAFYGQCPNDAENGQRPPLGSPAAVAKYNKQTETELMLNYQKLFVEQIAAEKWTEYVRTKDELSVLGLVNSDYETIARVWAQKAESVRSFVKLAYPELVECLVDGGSGNSFQNIQPETNTETTDSPKHTQFDKLTMLQNSMHSEIENQIEFRRRVIFDLDHLSHSERPLLLDNDDTLKIGTNIGEHLLFESRFESGNLHKAIQVSPTGYQLLLSPDINQSTAHFQWFFFQVSDMHSGVPYTFEIVNCVKKFSMFSKGMQPVLFSVIEAVRHQNPCWTRVSSSIFYYSTPKLEFDQHFCLSAHNQKDDFTSVPSAAGKDLCVERSSQANRLQREERKEQWKDEAESPLKNEKCKNRKKKKRRTTHKTAEDDAEKDFYTLRFTIQFPHDADVCYIAYHFPYTYSRLQATLERHISSASSDIYVHRQRLTNTLCLNVVPLLTITSSPLKVQKREFVMITARVHPGEANSSWIMHGLISFLLSAHSLAVRAREVFIFKLVPMLNPDGVINGSQRCSLSGQDLNRVWNDPSPALHPTIYHTKGLIQYMRDLVRKRPFAFIDLHGHSRKTNVFMYGNNSNESWRHSDRDSSVEAAAAFSPHLPQILDEISHSFALKDCSYSITKAKEFSARVTTWRQFGLERAYTMESTYCGFDQGPNAGRQIMMEDMKLVGADLVKALVQLWEVQKNS